jgi:glycosyltransferase involved in cell wall biosynthesis
MKIAQITYLYSPALGGVESHVQNLSEKLSLLDHQVEVFTSDFTSLDMLSTISKTTEVIHGVTVHRYHGKKAIGKNFWAQKMTFSDFEKDLIDGDFDVIHTHSIPSDHFNKAFKIAQRYNKKIFATPHFSPDDLERTFRTKLTPFYWRLSLIPKLKRINKIIAVSPSEKNSFVKLTGIDKNQIDVYPNAINIEEIESADSQTIRKLKSHYKNKKLILFVGRIIKTKGIDILIEAVAKLKNKDGFHLLIIGPITDDHYYHQLQDQITQLNVKNMVTIDQLNRKDVIAAFHACDIFVLPTRGEVFGIVLAEAMAAGKVVIGTKVGGIPDLIKDKQNGFLFTLEDSVDLAKKIEYVIQNPKLIQKIGDNAKNDIYKHYNWDTVAKKIAKLYEE